MISERFQRRLDHAAVAFARADCARERKLCERVLRPDLDNSDARAYLRADHHDTAPVATGEDVGSEVPEGAV